MPRVPVLPVEMWVETTMPLNSGPNAELIEAKVTRQIGRLLSLCYSLNSYAQYLVKEPCSRLAIRGTWARTCLEYMTTVNEAQNTVAHLRMLNSSYGTSSKILADTPQTNEDFQGWVESFISYHATNARTPRK